MLGAASRLPLTPLGSALVAEGKLSPGAAEGSPGQCLYLEPSTSGSMLSSVQRACVQAMHQVV